MQHQFILEKMSICFMPPPHKLGSALLELSSVWAGFCHLTSFRSPAVPGSVSELHSCPCPVPLSQRKVARFDSSQVSHVGPVQAVVLLSWLHLGEHSQWRPPDLAPLPASLPCPSAPPPPPPAAFPLKGKGAAEADFPEVGVELNSRALRNTFSPGDCLCRGAHPTEPQEPCSCSGGWAGLGGLPDQLPSCVFQPTRISIRAGCTGSLTTSG